MTDIEAIQAVVVRAAHLLDDKRWDEWKSLYTEDARYVVHTMDLQGRDTIADTLAPLMAQAMTKHLLGYPVVDVDGDEAEAFTDMTTFVGPKGSIAPVTIGRYHDHLVRTPAGWRLRSRTLVELGV